MNKRIRKKTDPRFSKKQQIVMRWWKDDKYKHHDAILCDGSVRSGKTTAMSQSFLMWAMESFNGQNFGICGKTLITLRRNVIDPLVSFAKSLRMNVDIKVSKNYFDVKSGARKNRFYLFGGKDESAAALIQGITLAGVLIDEAALLPRSFIEQSFARCSVSGSKLWLNCNPEGEFHWLKREWIDKREEKNLLYLHFTLDDNPSLSQSIKRRYHRLYSGVFYERFVLGKWVSAEGLVYPMFDKARHTFALPPENITRFAVSCDYGTVNPTSIGLWGESGGVWLRLKEYYFDSRREGCRRTDEEHYTALEQLCEGADVERIIVDPSASSFIECIKRHKRFTVTTAKNDVLAGIGRVSDALAAGKIKISCTCLDTIREFALYRWDGNGKDAPLKENDHAMDDIRYFVSEYLTDKEDSFFVMALDR
ncbi:MAG: PBSX family phage terminase large subunit [Ruminococcus sp.]|nr:PBSX family phage terminase large subunit [Ruminococcus sp.]